VVALEGPRPARVIEDGNIRVYRAQPGDKPPGMISQSLPPPRCVGAERGRVPIDRSGQIVTCGGVEPFPAVLAMAEELEGISIEPEAVHRKALRNVGERLDNIVSVTGKKAACRGLAADGGAVGRARDPFGMRA